MATLRTRAILVLLAAIPLGGCAACLAGRPPGSDPAPVRAAIRLANQSRDRIYVYLIEERQEWLLGRLDPLESAWLPLPARAPADGGPMLQLAVIAGTHISLRPSGDGRAVLTMRQPMSRLLIQRWAFTGGQLVALSP